MNNVFEVFQHRDDYYSNFAPGRKGKSSWMWDHVQEEHGGSPGQDYREDFTFRLMGSFRDCMGRQTDEAVRLDMVEVYGKVPGDTGEGVGGRIVRTLHGRGEYFQPKTVKNIFYQ